MSINSADPTGCSFITLELTHETGEGILKEVKPRSPKEPFIPPVYTYNNFKESKSRGIKRSSGRKSDPQIRTPHSPRVRLASESTITPLPEQDISALNPLYASRADTSTTEFLSVPLFKISGPEEQSTTSSIPLASGVESYSTIASLASTSIPEFTQQQSPLAEFPSSPSSENTPDLHSPLSPLFTPEGSNISCPHELRLIHCCKHCGYFYFPSNVLQLDFKGASQQDQMASSEQHMEVVESGNLATSFDANSIDQLFGPYNQWGSSVYDHTSTAVNSVQNNFPMTSSGPTSSFYQDRPTIPRQLRLTIPDNTYRDYHSELSTSVSSAGSSAFFSSPATTSVMTPEDYILSANPNLQSEFSFTEPYGP